MNYIDFHVHTKYTLGNGLTEIPELIKQAKKFGMKALAITDSGTTKGFSEFGKKCFSKGIKPIFGCGFYVAILGLEYKQTAHMVLIAKNVEGYKNLIKLAQFSYDKGLHNKPRIDFDILKQHNAGLACLTGGLGGIIDKPYIDGNKNMAIENLQTVKGIFGKDLYIELQDNGLELNQLMGKELIKIANEQDIKLIATGGSFYINPSDSVLCNKLREDNGNNLLEGNGYYFKSEKEIIQNFNHVPESIENTIKLYKEITLTGLQVMSIGMRRKDKQEFSINIIEDILKNNDHCRIGLSDNNVPYIVSLNYGYKDEYLYFHSATQGKKIDIAKNNSNVCYEISDNIEITTGKYAWDYTTKFRSLVGNSKLEFVEDLEEKKIAIQAIMDQVASVKDWGIPDKMLIELTIFKISTKGISCKIS
ncbi:MAG: PHP domain-containing protein [Spirochaetaceae bacterium]